VTYFESWLVEMVKIVVGEMRESCEPTLGATISARDRDAAEECQESYAKDWSDLERRAAVLLTQARALENRHLAGELTILDPHSIPYKMIASRCLARSHKLEQLALELAKPEGWPIKDDGTKVVLQ
jgi:hypothetical protein